MAWGSATSEQLKLGEAAELKVPPFFPPYYKSLKKNAGQALGGGGEQPASALWLLNGVCKGNEDPPEKVSVPLTPLYC